MESAKHWELPGEELGTGTRRSENHLNGGIDIDCISYQISSFVPHSNWGSKSTKFDDLLRERRSKSTLLETLQHMSGRPPLIVYEQNQNTSQKWRQLRHQCSQQGVHWHLWFLPATAHHPSFSCPERAQVHWRVATSRNGGITKVQYNRSIGFFSTIRHLAEFLTNRSIREFRKDRIHDSIYSFVLDKHEFTTERKAEG